MLSLCVKPGEYITVGDNVVIQCAETAGTHCKLLFNAPQSIQILRGKLVEEAGGQRPDCVYDQPQNYQSPMVWNRSKAQSLAKIRKTLSEMKDSPQKAILLRNIDNMFPPK